MPKGEPAFGAESLWARGNAPARPLQTMLAGFAPRNTAEAWQT